MMRTLRQALLLHAVAWIYWQSAMMVIVLFGCGKIASYLFGGLDWLPFDSTDLVALTAIIVAVGALMRYRLVRLQRLLDATTSGQRAVRAQRAEDALSAENEAAKRVARIVAQEFAQPLSGALGYSEMLMMRAGSLAATERQELEGVREGVLQLERMLQALYRAAYDPASCADGRRLADEVELCVAAPRPRLHVYGNVASVRCDDAE